MKIFGGGGANFSAPPCMGQKVSSRSERFVFLKSPLVPWLKRSDLSDLLIDTITTHASLIVSD